MKRILIVIFAMLMISVCMGIASHSAEPKVQSTDGYKAQETPTPTPTPTPSPGPSPSATATPVPEPEPVPTPTVTPSSYRSYRSQ